MLLRGGAAVRRRSATLAVMFGACLWSSSGAAQDCAFPAEAEALAIESLRLRMMVGALQCREGGGYNDFVRRFGLQIGAAQALVSDHFARTAGASSRSDQDRWSLRATNAWAHHARQAGQGYCDETHRLALELAGLPPGPSLVSVAERVSEPLRSHLPAACRAPDDPPAPLQPR